MQKWREDLQRRRDDRQREEEERQKRNSDFLLAVRKIAAEVDYMENPELAWQKVKEIAPQFEEPDTL